MNPEFLAKLNDSYEIVQKEYEDRFSPLIAIDTSESKRTTSKTTAAYVANEILDIVEKRFKGSA